MVPGSAPDTSIDSKSIRTTVSLCKAPTAVDSPTETGTLDEDDKEDNKTDDDDDDDDDDEEDSEVPGAAVASPEEDDDDDAEAADGPVAISGWFDHTSVPSSLIQAR